MNSRSIDSYSGNSFTLVERKVATGALRAGRMLVYHSSCIKIRVVLWLLLLESHHLLRQDSEDLFLHLFHPQLHLLATDDDPNS